MNVRGLLSLASRTRLGWSSGICRWSNQLLPWRGQSRAGSSNTALVDLRCLERGHLFPKRSANSSGYILYYLWSNYYYFMTYCGSFSVSPPAPEMEQEDCPEKWTMHRDLCYMVPETKVHSNEAARTMCKKLDSRANLATLRHPDDTLISRRSPNLKLWLDLTLNLEVRGHTRYVKYPCMFSFLSLVLIVRN